MTSAGVEDPSAGSKVECGAEVELEIDVDTRLGGGIEVTANRVSRARPIVVYRGAPSENTAGAGDVGSRGTETWIGGAMGPDCGPDIEGRTICSEEDAHVPSEENACATAGAGTGAPMSAEENGRVTSSASAGAPVSAEGGRRVASGAGAHGMLVRTAHLDI
jgi:hypothetical protein